MRILSAGGPPLSVQNVCRELVELGDKREREGKGREAGSVSWLALTVEKTRICICTAANISGSSVKPRPVQAGRVWPLTAAERISRSS